MSTREWALHSDRQPKQEVPLTLEKSSSLPPDGPASRRNQAPTIHAAAFTAGYRLDRAFAMAT